MPVNKAAYLSLKKELDEKQVTLVAVSKTKPVEDILELYQLGQKDFGENYVQELVTKSSQLPDDIRWHFIGHLQTNKVKLIAPFVQLIHGVDSLKLLKEINKEAIKNDRIIDCLLQMHIAMEETKFGLDEEELKLVLHQTGNLERANIRVCGLMGMASFTENIPTVRNEFRNIKRVFDKYAGIKNATLHMETLSIGMSGDHKTAIEEGSTMVRIGSLLFGERTQPG
jgi:PLP dependent protein